MDRAGIGGKVREESGRVYYKKDEEGDRRRRERIRRFPCFGVWTVVHGWIYWSVPNAQDGKEGKTTGGSESMDWTAERHRWLLRFTPGAGVFGG